MKPVTLAIALLLLSACSSTAVTPSYYLLRPDTLPQSGQVKPSKSFVFGDLQIAAYIDQPGILLETATGEVHAARQHLWAEPLQQGMSSYLRQEISRLSGENLIPAAPAPAATRINIRIDQLHGTLDGRALLVAYWWLASPAAAPDATGVQDKAEQFVAYQVLQRDGYAALAKAQKILLSALAERIAQSMDSPRA